MTQRSPSDQTAASHECTNRSPLEYSFGYYLSRPSGNGIGDFSWFESEQDALDSLRSRFLPPSALDNASALQQLPRVELVAADGSPMELRWAGALDDLQFGAEPFERVVQDDFILGVFPYPPECEDPHTDTEGFALHLENYRNWPVPVR